MTSFEKRNAKTNLDWILVDMERAFNAKLPYLSLSLALSIPDICSSLETTFDERRRYKIEDRYIEWCKRYLEPRYRRFTALDCWALRGGVLHNGMLFGHPKARFDRIVFMLGANMDECTADNTLQLSLPIFLMKIVHSVWEWEKEKKDDPTVAENMEHLVRFRPEGTWQFQGVPLIA